MPTRLYRIRYRQGARPDHGATVRSHSVLTLLPPKYESRRTLVVTPFLAELLDMLLASHKSEWVFPSINGGELAKAISTFHCCRKIADGQKAGKPWTKGGGRGASWRVLPGLPAVKNWAGKRLYLLRHGHKEWIDEDVRTRIAVDLEEWMKFAGQGS